MSPEIAGPAAPADLLRRLAGFFDFLRARHLDVGVGSQVDLARALDHVSVLDRDGFRDACRATLAKSPANLSILDEAFEVYWFTTPVVETGAAPPPRAPTSRPPADGRMESISTPSMPTGTTVPIGIRVGVYSPDAPGGGHSLPALDPRRLAAMRIGARGLRRAIATLPGRTSRPARRGAIDLRRTMRRAGRTSGETLDLQRARKRRARAELLVLWDVSGSMRDHDAVLAALVYSLRRLVRRTRVFAFSTEVREVSPVLAGMPYRISLDALARALGPAGGGTRIGRCLRDFRRGFGRLVHPWTTVVVLSDGWDLGDTDLLAWEVAWLHEKAHRIVWVNPYRREAGFRPDTEGMKGALPHVDLFLGPSDFESAPAPAIVGGFRRT